MTDHGELVSLVRETVAETVRSLSSIVDVEARHGVSAALQKIESHERVCAERDRNADEQRSRMEQKIDALGKIIWATMVWALLGLVAVVLFLIRRELLP